jgi:hypothetical protein
MAPPDIPGEGQESPHAAHGPHTLTFSEILVGLGAGSSKLAVSEIVAAFGARALAAIMLLWALVNFLPLPPGGTTITGAPLLLLSMELAVGRQTLWLPRKMLRSSISREGFRKSFGWLVPMVRLAERLSRPRLPWLSNRFAKSLIGLICFLLSIVLVLPIPLGNIAPAITIALFSLGLMQRDGVVILLGWLSTAISVGLLALVWRVLWAAVEAIIDKLTAVPVVMP